MSADAVTRIESVRGKKFTAEEAARLREIGGALRLRADDTLWDILAALEYQRAFYEALPEKIAGASTEVLRGISAAADKEAAAAQARLADCVVQQARRLSTKLNYVSILPMGLCALVCMMGFGSLLLCVGYHLGSEQAYGTFRILRMPSGVLMGGIALFGGLCLGVHTAREFAEGDRAWKKEAAIVVAMLTAGGALFGLGVM